MAYKLDQTIVELGSENYHAWYGQRVDNIEWSDDYHLEGVWNGQNVGFDMYAFEWFLI